LDKIEEFENEIKFEEQEQLNAQKKEKRIFENISYWRCKKPIKNDRNPSCI